jgi:phosphoribosylformylglycinamidine synthase II
MLSESQERMLMVLKPEKEATARAIFKKWGLDFAVVGRTTDDLRFKVRHQGEIVAELPIKQLGEEAPVYSRPFRDTQKGKTLKPEDVPGPTDLGEALLKLLGSPNLCSKRWVWEQYDHLILGNTLQRPGGDAAVVRIGAGPKALALTADVNPRYCEADPFEGGKQAVAECWRNLTAVGARPLALTDNLNFGNPERPEIMGQFVAAVRGIGEAARALDFPVVSGNVSLYNETAGQAILPTPTIGGVGLLEDCSIVTTIAPKAKGETVLLLGSPKGWLGQSSFLSVIHGREEGLPPPVDPGVERRHGDFVRDLIRSRRLTACHDVSDGGPLVALAEMAMAGGLGIEISFPDSPVPLHARLFGEDQACYVMTAEPEEAEAITAEAAQIGVPITVIGCTGGDHLTVRGALSISVDAIRTAHEEWLPRFMASGVI